MPSDPTTTPPTTDDLCPISVISITIDHDDPLAGPTYDLGGVSPWEAYSIVQSVANDLWDQIPEPTMGHPARDRKNK